MTHKIKSRLEPETPPAPPGIKGVPEPLRGPSLFEDQIVEEAELTWVIPPLGNTEAEPMKEKRKYKRGDYRLTPQGSLLMSTIPAFFVSLLIFIGMLIWDNESVVCYYLFTQAFLSIVASGFIWLALLKKIEFSILYPTISVSYIIGLFAAIFIFKETVGSYG